LFTSVFTATEHVVKLLNTIHRPITVLMNTQGTYRPLKVFFGDF